MGRKRKYPDPQAEKECLRCRLVLPAENFYTNKRASSGLHTWCKPCCAERQRDLAKKRSSTGDYIQRPQKKCGKCLYVLPAAQFYRYRSSIDGLSGACKRCQKRSAKESTLRIKYGISSQVQSQMLAAQNHSCAICEISLGGELRPQTDHDHSTGQVRGILCINCNVGLGSFHDDPEKLEAAIRYLGRYGRPVLRAV